MQADSITRGCVHADAAHELESAFTPARRRDPQYYAEAQSQQQQSVAKFKAQQP
jgi:hypothetical protein